VDLSQDVLEGWGVASDGGITVALDLELTPGLRSEGLAREVVRVVQDARRTAGLEVGDRIVLNLGSEGAVADAIRAHAGTIAGETLAVELREDLDDAEAPVAEVDGTPVRVRVRRA
jgi:isoleucyl-tRNA synthetase